MRNALWQIFEIAVNYYQGLIIALFVYRFLSSRSSKLAKRGLVISGVAFGTAVTVLNLLTIYEGYTSLIYFFILFLYAVIAFKDNIIKKVLSTIIPNIILLLITTVELNLVSSIEKISVQTLIINKDIVRFFTLIAIQVSLLIALKIIIKLFEFADNYTISDWVPIIATLIVSFVLVSLLHVLALSADNHQRLYINIAYLTIIILDFLMFYIIYSLYLKNYKIKEMEMLSIREQHMKQFVDNANYQYELIRKIKHDIKNQLSAVYILISKDETQEAMDLIASSSDVVNSVESFVKTNNAVANSIINSKLSAASALGIKVSCITVNDFIGVSELDLCDLLSNTLENALTACENMSTETAKFIYLEISKENNIYTFLIKNSIEQSVLSKNPRLQTTKLDKADHGLGTSIIKDISEKYNGRCDFYESDNMFCCQVILMARETDSN